MQNGPRVPRSIREQQMLDAAVEEFAECGFHDTSMDAVARRAEISKPMVYLYYGSKWELFEAAIARESNSLLEAINSSLEGLDSPREQLRSVIKAFIDFAAKKRNSWSILYREVAARQGQVQWDREHMVTLTSKMLKRSSRIPITMDASMLMATALVGAGEAIAERVSRGLVEPSDAEDMLFRLAWRGLSGSPVKD